MMIVKGGLIPILRLDSSSRPTTVLLAHKPFLHQYVPPYKQYLKINKKKGKMSNNLHDQQDYNGSKLLKCSSSKFKSFFQ